LTKPAQFNDWPASIQPGYGPYRAVVERIVDGDTLYAFVDLGLNKYAYESVRLKDVNAPELFTSDPLERERGRLARAKLESVCPPGTKALMHTQKDAASFGRYVATLTLADGTVVNAAMNDYLANS
jgi:micrococcal nuclease